MTSTTKPLLVNAPILLQVCYTRDNRKLPQAIILASGPEQTERGQPDKTEIFQSLRFNYGGRKMAAIASVLDRALGIQIDSEPLKTLALFCGTGFAVSLIATSYGLDLSAAFF